MHNQSCQLPHDQGHLLKDSFPRSCEHLLSRTFGGSDSETERVPVWAWGSVLYLHALGWMEHWLPNAGLVLAHCTGPYCELDSTLRRTLNSSCPCWILMSTQDHFLFLPDQGTRHRHMQQNYPWGNQGGVELGEVGNKCADAEVVVQKEGRD